MDKDKDNEVFLDAEEEITPRRTGRKRRSTAGNSVGTSGLKKPRPAKKMPVERSPSKRSQPLSPDEGGQAPVPDLSGDTDAFWKKLGGMLGSMESRITKENESVKVKLGQAIGDLGERMEKTERRMDGLVEEVHSIVDQKLARVVEFGKSSSALDPVVSKETGGREPNSYALAVMSGGKPTLKRTEKKSDEEWYWECRRSLRMRPILAGNDKEEVDNYMRQYLGLSSAQIDSLGPYSVRRVPFGPSAKIKNEVVVTYQTTEARDVVKGAARNLAGKSSDYGIRLELPNYLKSAMTALQSVSYSVKQRFPLARRNVLFDDSTLDLVLDICTGEGQEWRRITSAQAKQRKKKAAKTMTGSKMNFSDGELDDLLDQESHAAGQDSQP